jgi:hypothetical protein
VLEASPVLWLLVDEVLPTVSVPLDVIPPLEEVAPVVAIPPAVTVLTAPVAPPDEGLPDEELAPPTEPLLVAPSAGSAEQAGWKPTQKTRRRREE